MAKKKTTRTTSKKTTKKSTASGGTKKSSRKTTTLPRSAAAKKRDEGTVKKITKLTDSVVKESMASRDPFFDIPMRTASNVSYNAKRKILELGSSTQRRNLFNLGQAKKFMQMLLVSAGCKELCESGKTLSLRGMYYSKLHTIPGTKEKTFGGQEESDAVLEDLEVTADALREELHVFAKKRGTMVGNITIIDNGDTIDCRRMGTGGYAIPSHLSNRRRSSSRSAMPTSSSTSRRTPSGAASTRIASGRRTTAS
jgi:DNA topoisomerase-6 subunit A